MSVLVITLPAEAGVREAGWALVSGGAVLDEGRMSADAAPDLKGARPERAVALIPSETLFLRRVEAPGKSERDARRAAPFLIEDHLAAALEDTVVEAGPRDAAGLRLVAAAGAELRDTWRRLAAAAGIKPVYAVPDALAPDAQGADLFAFEAGGRVLFQTRAASAQTEDGSGETPAPRDAETALREPLCGAVETELAGHVLPALAARIAPRRLLIGEGLDPALAAPDDAPVALKRVPAPDLRLAAAALDPVRLQLFPPMLGAGLASGLNWSDLLRPWRAAAALLVAAVVLSAAFAAGQAAYLDHRTDLYRDAEIAVFEEAFPQAGPARRVQTQLRDQLARVGAADAGMGFLDLAAALAALTAEEEAVEITAMHYDAARGALRVSARYSGFDDFERLRARAETLGVDLEDGGARQAETGVVGEFTVRAP